MLRLGVDDVRVLRIDDGLEAVAAGRDVPVGVDDAVHRARARRAAERCCCPACRRRRCRTASVVVERHLVELRQREVLEPRPGRAAVERLVEAAVAPADQVIGVVGVDPEHVVVARA